MQKSFINSTMAKQIQVVQLPFSAFGHILPHFQLSIALASSGVHVFFVGTPKNLQRLPQIPPPLSALITLVPLPLPPIPGADSLPDGAEATVDLPLHKVPLLELALDLLEPSFRKFLADLPSPPDWFIVDFNATWICNVSRDLQIPILFFDTLAIGFLAFMENVVRKNGALNIETLTTPLDFDEFQSAISFRRFEASAMLNAFPVETLSGTSVMDRVNKIKSASEAILIRASYESDPHYLSFFSRNCSKRVIPLGHLPPEKPKKTEYAADSPWNSNFEWLVKQNPQSVVFVGFGSECRLTRDQIREIARGLELSDLPFFWSLRKPAEEEEESSDCDPDGLPIGFRERTAERGIVSVGWAPQMEILADPAIGGCLFHAGLGTTMEALQFGHCLVPLPFSVDQPLNSRVLVEKGVAVEVERNEDGGFSGEAIAKALTKAMGSEEGKKIRGNAKKAAAIYGDRKLHQRYIQDFVKFLKNG